MTKNTRRNFFGELSLGTLGIMSMPLKSKENPIISERPKISEQKLTILFQGDSITDGNRSRNNDWNHVLGHGYAYLIASRLWFDYPERELMFYNRGISGNTVKNLRFRWDKDAIDLKPDVISILIGVNDIFFALKDNTTVDLDQFRASYQEIIDQTGKDLPNTRIVICEPFILPVGQVKDQWANWKAQVSSVQKSVSSIAQENGLVFIGLQEKFDAICKKAAPEHWIWDGIHPMPGGHELIARTWITEVFNAFHR